MTTQILLLHVVSKCYASWCNLYKLFQLHSLKIATGKKNHDLVPELAAYALKRSFIYASHQCGRDSPTPIAIYIRSGAGRNTTTT